MRLFSSFLKNKSVAREAIFISLSVLLPAASVPAGADDDFDMSSFNFEDLDDVTGGGIYGDEPA